MKRRIIVLMIPVFILLGFVSTVVGLERQRTPDWQATLNQYIGLKANTNIFVDVQEVSASRRPWNFREEMESAFRNPDDWRWQIDRLPYPPDDLYCVLIDRHSPPSGDAVAVTERQVVYVAHHSDALWRVGWIVHEGPVEPFLPEVAIHFSTLGCDLERL